VLKKLRDIGDLSTARDAGLGRVSELEVTYQLFLLPAGDEGTRLKITSEIDAVDRSEALYLGPGGFQVIPRRIPIPSRGVLERDLMRRITADLFTAEEVFISSTNRNLISVGEIAGHSISAPGPVCERLLELFDAYISDYVMRRLASAAR